MKDLATLNVGLVVYSVSGRDKGRFYVIFEVVDDTFVKIVDGDLRRIEKPKLKKVKHLRTEGEYIEKFREKFTGDIKVLDAEVKAALKRFNSGLKTEDN